MSSTVTEPQINPMKPERVAVIAIHGVADQNAGDTARAVAGLMVNVGGAHTPYSEGECDSFILAVPPLSSLVPSRSPQDDNVRMKFVDNHNGSRTATLVRAQAMKPIEKAFRQSFSSDFQRPNWITTRMDQGDLVKSISGVQNEHGLSPVPPDPKPADAGIAFSDYLLFKAERNGTDAEAYEATRIRMTRRSEVGPSVQQVDVHEMYWADLSRLSGVVPRVITELFTMVFRLSRLGRDAVDEASRVARELPPSQAPVARRWTRLAAAQTALDWAYSGVLANLFLQLLLMGLVIAALGFAAQYPDPIRSAAAWLVPALGLWWFCYRYPDGPVSTKTAILAAVTAVLLLHNLPAHLVIGLTCLAVIWRLCDYGLRIADERFPAMRAVGLTLLGTTLLVLLGHVIANATEHGTAMSLYSWVAAGMRMVEYLLLIIVLWWVWSSCLLIAWVILGEIAAQESSAARAAVVTGRVGLFVSIASFLVLSMALWACLSTVIELGAIDTCFRPLIFRIGDGLCPVNGAEFLADRYKNSTETFALVAGLTLLLLLYVLMILVPSILAEVKTTVGTSQTLGRWLTAGYQRLDTFVTLLVSVSVIVAFTIGILLFMARFDATPGGWIGATSEWVSKLSNDVLKPLVLGTATAAAAFSAFGGILSRYVPWLRLPLDVVLDVDNHFREFPRRAIPRARIFSRYVALLEHIVAQGYDRVVIVAHSQGTVISAELLRYLQYRARKQTEAGVCDRVVLLWSHLQGRIDLLTAGCPLRQLYAARFPDLYAWVLQARDGRSGPTAADIGVRRWVNVYTTGDYVGRWLWCDAPPAVDRVDGRAILYDVCTTLASTNATERDVCLGSGAHTQYFDQSEKRVAKWIDALVVG